ncbi:MAG: pyridoxal-phosphate dependent enzyme [Gemmatimonadaceae bacterium]
MTPRLSIENIARAATTIDPVFLNSPQYRAESLGEALGVSITVKVETVNPIRSFKGRGADFFVRECADPSVPLVCASAGNFGQGLAYAARRAGVTFDVFASTRANELKVERMRALGATVHRAGDDFDAAKGAARAYAQKTGRRYVEDGRDVAISEGAGTIGVELLEGNGRFDTLVVPLGNGALLAGVGAWVRAHAPNVRILGVCAAGAPSMQQSWRARRVIETPTVSTIADGIAVRVPIPEALEDLRDVVDDIVLVDDAMTLTAMRLLFSHMGLVVEPAGAVGVAALLALESEVKGTEVATILCGGNLTAAQIDEYALMSRTA